MEAPLAIHAQNQPQEGQQNTQVRPLHFAEYSSTHVLAVDVTLTRDMTDFVA